MQESIYIFRPLETFSFLQSLDALHLHHFDWMRKETLTSVDEQMNLLQKNYFQLYWLLIIMPSISMKNIKNQLKYPSSFDTNKHWMSRNEWLHNRMNRRTKEKEKTKILYIIAGHCCDDRWMLRPIFFFQFFINY